MSEDWSRRALLASLGTVAIAGCTGGQGSNATQATTTRTESTPTESPTPTPTPTPDREPEPPSSIDSEWPSPGHDPGRSNGSAAAAGPTEPVAELWRRTDEGGLSAPVVADGTVFVGRTDGVVLAIDARDGAERWRRSVGTAAFTPRARDGVVYVPTATGIVALRASDGSRVWGTDTPDRADRVGDDATVVPVLVASHGVYWIAGGDSPAVVRLAPADGSELWRTGIGDPWTRRLFATDGTVFVSTGTSARVPWTIAAGTGDVVEKPTGAGADFLGERFHRDGSVYAASGFRGLIEAAPVGDGGDGWESSLAGGRYALAGGPDRVYVAVSGGTDPGLYALSADDGATAWSASASPRPFGRPVVAGETVLVRTGNGLRCFDPADGTERWTRPTGGVGGRFAAVDDLIYATAGDTLRAFRPP